MKRTFPIDLYEGHLIFELDGKRFLVDTGSTYTISRERILYFLGNEYICKKIPGLDIDSLSGKMHGMTFDVLLGVDSLADFTIMIDYKNLEITFSDEELELSQDYTIVPLRRGWAMGEYGMQVQVRGRTLNFALASGSMISYVDKDITEDLTPTGEIDDFYVAIGQFSTKTYKLDVTVKGLTFPAVFGNHSTDMQSSFRTAGIDGAIGYDLFVANTVVLQLKSSLLYLKPVQ